MSGNIWNPCKIFCYKSISKSISKLSKSENNNLSITLTFNSNYVYIIICNIHNFLLLFALLDI